MAACYNRDPGVDTGVGGWVLKTLSILALTLHYLNCINKAK